MLGSSCIDRRELILKACFDRGPCAYACTGLPLPEPPTAEVCFFFRTRLARRSFLATTLALMSVRCTLCSSRYWLLCKASKRPCHSCHHEIANDLGCHALPSHQAPYELHSCATDDLPANLECKRAPFTNGRHRYCAFARRNAFHPLLELDETRLVQEHARLDASN